jgi:hypothetical protein
MLNRRKICMASTVGDSVCSPTARGLDYFRYLFVETDAKSRAEKALAGLQ